MNRVITTPVGIRGHIAWRAYDRRGRPTPVRARDARGRERFIAGGAQSNLITDNGMNAIAGSWVLGRGIWETDTTSAQTANWRRFARFGTGSAAPSFTDTTLDNQVLASVTSGAFTGFAIEGTGTANDTWTARYMYRRLAEAADAVNLTEFGLSWSESDSDLAVRELFRDEFGDPITLQLPAGAFIRLDHWLELQLDLSENTGTLQLEEFDIFGDLVTTHNIDYAVKLYARTSGADSDVSKTRHLTHALRSVGTISTPIGTGNAVLRAPEVNPALPDSFAGALVPSGWGGTGSSGFTADHPEYVAGSHEIVRRFVLDPAIQNGAWYGYGKSYNGFYDGFTNIGGGLLIAFRNGDSHTKASTHALTWEHRLSWARA